MPLRTTTLHQSAIGYIGLWRPIRPIRPILGFRHLSEAQASDVIPTQAELHDARHWLDHLTVETIPQDICNVSFSRSSGPGGQNVNKYGPIQRAVLIPRTNSKATIHVPFEKLQAHVPALLLRALKDSRFYARNADALVIQADDDRKQANNLRSSLVKLKDLMMDVGNKAIPGQTSEEQKQRVRKMAEQSYKQRLAAKRKHSDKKASRKSGKGDWE